MMNDETDQATLVEARSDKRNGKPAVADEERPGYRYVRWTGWIPSDWKTRPLLDAVDIKSGQVDPSMPPYDSMVLVAPDHIETSTGRLLKRVTAAEQGAISGKYHFQSGDIIYSKIRPYLRKATLVDFEGLCSADMYPLTPSSDIEPGYLLASLLGSRFSSFAEAVSVRSGIPKINRSELAEYRIALPPLPEQRKIARILGAWDRALADLDALIEAKRRRKRGLAQRLLTGRVRLPGFEDDPWKTVRLTDVTRESRGRNDGTLGQDRLYGVTKAEGMIPNQDRINVDDVSRYKVVRPNAFAYNPMRLNIGSIARLREPVPVLASPDYVVFECLPDKLDPGFLDHLRRGHDWKRFMEVAGAGSVRVRIYYKHLRLLKLRIPKSVEEQRRIAAVLDAADAELAALEDQRAALARQKRVLMQRLLTGEVRVTPDAEDYETRPGRS